MRRNHSSLQWDLTKGSGAPPTPTPTPRVFAVPSPTLTSGSGRGKVTEQMTKVTTALTREFRCGLGRRTGGRKEPGFLLSRSETQPLAVGAGKDSGRGPGGGQGGDGFSNGTFSVLLEFQTQERLSGKAKCGCCSRAVTGSTGQSRESGQMWLARWTGRRPAVRGPEAP